MTMTIAAPMIDLLRDTPTHQHRADLVDPVCQLSGRTLRPAVILDRLSVGRGSGCAWPPACRSPGVLVEDLSQSSGECFGLAGISELAAHEAAVMAREHRRLLTK